MISFTCLSLFTVPTPQHPDQALIKEANVILDELISTFLVQIDHTSHPIVALLTEGNGTPLYIDKKYEHSRMHSNLIEGNMDIDY